MSEPTREMRDKAIAVARDVIEQVSAAGSYEMTQGTYVGKPTYHLGGDLRDHFDVLAPGCQVCMLGAALLSKARMYGNVPSSIVIEGRSAIAAALAEVFDARTLDLMECAFEEDPSMGALWEGDDESRGAAVFGNRFLNDDERAVAVAENIIANDGLFVVAPVKAEDFVLGFTGQFDDSDEADDFGDEEDDLWEEGDEEDDL